MRRVWWIFALVAIAPLAAAVGVGWLLNAEDMQFLWGAGLGASATALMMLTGPQLLISRGGGLALTASEPPRGQFVRS